ncbi:MAG: UDP-N-acetylglucosamine 1-carboxyvinyltransferase [candidate division Zixibacteria bacterium SM23_81]|nr:MAG: UDP-N-acetylglucosamine 1-carboxyvinyltransferase [candidate division Zixibacteria bacterium SM23_81]
MDKIVVAGGKRLAGAVDISGAKNAALPMMAATILASGESTLLNVPHLKDVSTFSDVLRVLGARVKREGNSLIIDTSSIEHLEAPYELVRTMRASIYVLGPLLARFGQARVSLPGGCAWGPRPVNLHLKILEEMGAHVEIQHGYIMARAGKLQGALIDFDVSSVGATANAMMAASLASGNTLLRNAAREPEIEALGQMLSSMGASVSGAGSGTVEIQGAKTLRAVRERIIPDRIEAGTYMVATAMTGGKVTLRRARADHLGAVIDKMAEAGVTIRQEAGNLVVEGPTSLVPVNVTTSPYPGFPTDMQAQFMALLSLAQGTSVITETIFPDRFTHVPELRRLGVKVTLDANVAKITGVKRLSGAPVMASDLRASAALVLAALVAQGETEILRVYHIDRGYERIEEKLRGLGAEIQRVRV